MASKVNIVAMRKGQAEGNHKDPTCLKSGNAKRFNQNPKTSEGLACHTFNLTTIRTSPVNNSSRLDRPSEGPFSSALTGFCHPERERDFHQRGHLNPRVLILPVSL